MTKQEITKAILDNLKKRQVSGTDIQKLDVMLFGAAAREVGESTPRIIVDAIAEIVEEALNGTVSN